MKKNAIRIPVSSASLGLEGEIAIVPAPAVRDVDQERLQQSPVSIVAKPTRRSESVLLRGGFNVGRVPGLPSMLVDEIGGARIRLLWQTNETRRYLSTNLARTSAVNRRVVGANVAQLWIRFLLEHQSELPEGFMSRLRLESRRYTGEEEFRLKDFNWLEEYDAYTLYTLAKNGWQFDLRDFKVDVGRMADWESSKDAMPFSTYSYLYVELLNVVLPRVVSSREFNSRGIVYISPPKPDWREILEVCHDFISKPVVWPPYAMYTGGIDDHVYHSWATNDSIFNEKYASQLSCFETKDLNQLPTIFNDLLRNRKEGRHTEFDERRGTLLQRAIEAIGHLTVSSIYGACRLDSFGKLSTNRNRQTT
jgi:hypothetical protein